MRFLKWLFRREEPSVYHKCLAVHLYFSNPRSALHD